jgi:molecular chaperone GrpE
VDNQEVPQTEAEVSHETSPAPEPVTIGDVWQQRASLLEEKLKISETELAQEKDKALRAYAEMENFKRRKEQELAQFRQYAQEKSVTELLPILDSFDRACAHLGEGEHANGFILIQKQFHSVMEKWGVVPIEALNQTFDPNLHQAVMEEEVEGVASGIVTKEMQKGYKLHERVIRPSMVTVSK